jgi:molybdopterin molybdotransferase
VLTPAQALKAIDAAMPHFGDETVPLSGATGKVLRQDVSAERDQPPFDRVMMDGIAIQFDSYRKGLRKFRVQSTQQAGDPVQLLANDRDCIEIMTGAVMPNGTDCVIPVERVDIDGQFAIVEEDYEASPRQFIHAQGSDHRIGRTILTKGSTISPMDIAVIASSGIAEVKVARSPLIRVISTGNELVAAGLPILSHQVRLSNGPAVLAMLGRQGFARSEHDHLVDNPVLLRDKLAQHLDEAEVLVLSGGVSMGKADFVPQVLADLGVTQVFHRVSQQPGKPLWFGTGQRSQSVFALPGNPVSTLVCCRHYVLPSLLKASGRRETITHHAMLAHEITYAPALTRYLPVKTLSRDDGVTVATPITPNTSGDFASLSGTAGYVELSQEQTRFEAGTTVPLHLWDFP